MTLRRRHKYGARAGKANAAIWPELAGRRFDSQLERDVATMLVIRQRAGEIADLAYQATVTLSAAHIKWRIDFAYIETATGVRWHHEAKGMETEAYRLKLKLYRAYGPGPLRITKATHGRLTTVEVHGPMEGKT